MAVRGSNGSSPERGRKNRIGAAALNARQGSTRYRPDQSQIGRFKSIEFRARTRAH